MSDEYRLMIYFSVATLHFYRDDLTPMKDGDTLGDFSQNNDAVLKRVSDEAKSLFGYELSSEQLGRAIAAYVAKSLSVSNTEVATLKE